MSTIKELEKKSVLVLGLGREGISTYSFLRKQFLGKLLGLADKRALSELDDSVKELIGSDRQVKLFLGNEYLESVVQYDVIFKSPGITPSIPELVAAQISNKKISSNTELFFEICKGTIIGITGTKGKSTTTSLIYEVLKSGGYDARLAGNFGVPPLSTLGRTKEETIFVTELSSFQLMNLDRSPHIAILLNIAPEHLDYHQTFVTYIKAKQKITRFQTENDYLIYNASHPIPMDIAKNSIARKLPFGFTKTGKMGCYLKDQYLIFHSKGEDEQIIPVSEISLKGRFNLQNVMPAILVGKIYAIPTKIVVDTIRDYKPLEHRLEFVSKCNGICFYNDSIATNPEAAIAGINAFLKDEIVLIAGGFDRGLSFSKLSSTIITNNVKAVILFPTTGEKIWNEIVLLANGKDNLPEHTFVTNMEDAVKTAYNLAKEGDIVLLSPGSASFGCFKDYRDRGRKFKEEVVTLNIS